MILRLSLIQFCETGLFDGGDVGKETFTVKRVMYALVYPS
jgi:hypothetical protein